MADPYALWLDNDIKFSHLVRAERFVQSWLETNRYSCDVYSDLDLHKNDGLLNGYRAVIICSHSEYWSSEMRSNLSSYLEDGGNVICLSANTMYWRVALEENGETVVMENRKFGGFAHDPNKVDETRFGQEMVMSSDARRGGLIRDVGQPCYELLGLETYGAITPDSIYENDWRPYTVKKPKHFLFNGIGLRSGDKMGVRSLNGPSACGNEFDISLSSFAYTGAKIHIPGDSSVEILARVEYGDAPPQSGAALGLDGRDMKTKPMQGADMIYWERKRGGRVFNVGSMTFGGALSEDRNLQLLMKNVLAHFGVAPN